MQTVNATEAKARLAELLRTVERGETVAITRHGKPIAHVVPAPAGGCTGRKDSVARFRHQRETWEPAGLSIYDILRGRHDGHRR